MLLLSGCSGGSAQHLYTFVKMKVICTYIDPGYPTEGSLKDIKSKSYCSRTTCWMNGP